MFRPTIHQSMMSLAYILAQRGTCAKRKVGCVLTDIHGRIVGTGYNGVARGLPHCTEHGCGGEHKASGSDTCQAVHAEINALLFCPDVLQVQTCYCTTLPCNYCMKTLLNTSCQLLVYTEKHDHADAVLQAWTKAGRQTICLPSDFEIVHDRT